MTTPHRPRAWEHLVESPADRAVWEAAERAAASAPEIKPGDDAYLRLRPLLQKWLNQPSEQERGAA